MINSTKTLTFYPLLFFQLPPCSKSFQEAQTDLNHTAAELNHSAGDVVQSSRGSSSQLAVASGKFSQDFDEFLDAGIEMAGHTQVQFQCLLRAGRQFMMYSIHREILLVQNQVFHLVPLPQVYKINHLGKKWIVLKSPVNSSMIL